MLAYRTPRELDKVAMPANHPYGFVPVRRLLPATPPISPLDALFPTVPPVPADADAKSPWGKEATELATLLDRRPALAALPGGLTVERTLQYPSPRQATGEGRTTELVSPRRWATRHATETYATHLEWCDGVSRVAVNAAFQLARRRDAKPADLTRPPLEGSVPPMPLLWEQYAGTAAVEGGTVIVVTSADGRTVVRVTIDPAKKVVTRVETRTAGQPDATVTTYGGFVQVRGLWWDTATESATGGQVTIRTAATVTETDDAAFAKAFDALTAPLAKCVVKRQPAATLSAATAARAAGKATTDDRFTLLRQALAFQRFEEATAEFDAIGKLEAGKPGLTWLRVALHLATRRNEEARQRMLAAVPEVLALPTPGDRIALAHWLTQDASHALGHAELRELRDQFAGLYDALPVTNQHRRNWVTLCYSGLGGAEAFAYLKARAAEDPTSFELRTAYLQLLYRRGDRDAAYAGVREQLAAKDVWQKREVTQFYGLLAEFQEGEGRLPEKVETLTAWLAFADDDQTAAWQLLSALVRTDAEPKADALATKWLAEAKAAAPTPAQLARAFAAIRHVAGQADRLPSDRLDPKWVPVLADAARAVLDQEQPTGLAETLLTNYQFVRTDTGAKLVAERFDRLLTATADRPVPRLTGELQWLGNVQGVGRDRWVKLTAAVSKRWAAVADDDEKHQLGELLASLLRQQVFPEEALAFARERTKSGPAAYRKQYRAALFDALQAAPWGEARADEAYDLVPEFLADAAGKPLPAADAATRLMQLDDWAMPTRAAALQAELKNPERLTRPELKAKREEATRQARGELIARLTKREATYPAPLKPWAKLERLTLQARRDADPNALAAELATLTGDAPLPAPAADADATPEQSLAFELQGRAVALAMHAATRRAAKPETVARLRGFLDAGVAAQPGHDGWKQAKFDLLVALDLPKELEGNLAAWARAGDPTARWRTALGYLLAELGRLKEAIAVFEGIKEIDAAAYGRAVALSQLYLAVDDKAKHDAARIDSYRHLSEQQLGQMLQAKQARWQPNQGDTPPTELDADTLPILAALVEKMTNADYYFGTVQALYRASKDFRVPATLADGALGQTPGKAYRVVAGLQSLFNDLHDEASADSVIARVEVLRPKAKSPTDLRALDLIAMQIHHRAAAVKNQPGPHAELALAAFRRAYDRTWAEGERTLMARLLAGLPLLTPEALGAEQLRQLKGLHDATPKGTPERLEIAVYYATTLRDRGKAVEAVGVLTPALAEAVAATGGRFTDESFPAAALLTALHTARNDYAAAEKLWLGWRAAAANDPLQVTIGNTLDALYLRAFEAGAEVSLGTGEALYATLLARLHDRLRSPEPGERSQTLTAFSGLLRVAGAKVFLRTGADVLKLANESFPARVKPWEPQYAGHLSAVAQMVHDHAGSVNAWAFVIDRTEALPAWLRRGRSGGLGLHSWQYGHYAKAPADLPAPLQARLLAIVLADLTGDLRARQAQHRGLAYAYSGYYWAAKEADFAAAAEAVLAESKDSVATQLHVADYLYRSVNRGGRAIDILNELHRAMRLDPAGRTALANYLYESRRYAEAVALLVPLVEESPDDLNLCTRLIWAYSYGGKPAELRELFGRSVARWRGRGPWGVGAMAHYASVAQQCDLNAESAALYAELIPNAQRQDGSPNSGLADYYRNYSLVLTKLGRSVEAVDAAGGAIVAWGGHLTSGHAGLAALNEAVKRAADLDALVAHFDKQTAETGLVNPTLRKALGQAYRDRQNFGPAVVQFELAVGAQPNDPETFTLLIGCYDAANRKADAAARILESLDLSRRDLARYEDLGNRYAAAGDLASAERAYTSLVEATRGEAEGQAALARVRQRQDRWEDAALHWGQVHAVRSLEPAGLLGLAAAQLHLKRFDAARGTLRTLAGKSWPPHAGDTPARVRELEASLPK